MAAMKIEFGSVRKRPKPKLRKAVASTEALHRNKYIELIQKRKLISEISTPSTHPLADQPNEKQY
jgi:hypothetical protein